MNIVIGVVFLLENIKNIFNDVIIKGSVLIDEPMKAHTSFKIGGPADLMVIPGNEGELLNAVNICRNNKINFYIMGNGTNLLVSDKGIRGVVIKVGDGLGEIRIENNIIKAGAGALLSTVSKVAMKNLLEGMEFASGIPGSIGGAVMMNAGAYGGEMKDIISRVKCLNEDGDIVYFNRDEMNFRYRKSRIGDENLIALEAEIELDCGDKEEIEKKMNELRDRRNLKQPLNVPSGGSTFKRPEGFFAGKLIEDSGLRGLRFGGAQVSEKHCGFIVNIDNATCEDVKKLIRIVQKVVQDNFDLILEPEIKIIGEE